MTYAHNVSSWPASWRVWIRRLEFSADWVPAVTLEDVVCGEPEESVGFRRLHGGALLTHRSCGGLNGKRSNRREQPEFASLKQLSTPGSAVAPALCFARLSIAIDRTHEPERRMRGNRIRLAVFAKLRSIAEVIFGRPRPDLMRRFGWPAVRLSFALCFRIISRAAMA